jgi:hypothetical protein
MYLILNYFFGTLFHSANDLCFRQTGNINCSLRPEGFIQPLYLTLINGIVALLFFMYMIAFFVRRVAFLRKNKIIT